MYKTKLLTYLLVLTFVISACSGSPAAGTTQQAELPPAVTADYPTPYPDTPVPPQINAPLVEAPSLINIRFLNERDGWGVTDTKIVRTNDGGITWYDVTPPNITEAGYAVDMFVLDNDHIWLQNPDISNYPNSGTMLRTTDGGMTWTSSPNSFSRGQFTFLDPNNGWVLADLGAGAGSNAVAVFQTTDGGATWTQTFSNDPNQVNSNDSLPLGGIKSGLTPLNMQTAWIGGIVYSDGAVYLYRTDNGGATWAQVSPFQLHPDALTTQISFYPPVFVDAQNAYLSMIIPADQITMAIYISHDGGNTWALTPTLIPNGGAADFLSATDAIIYTGDQFSVTHDAAQTWSTVTPDVSFGDTFAILDFVNPSTGWVLTADLDDHRSLYRTTDGGSTWSLVIP